MAVKNWPVEGISGRQTGHAWLVSEMRVVWGMTMAVGGGGRVYIYIATDPAPLLLFISAEA